MTHVPARGRSTTERGGIIFKLIFVVFIVLLCVVVFFSRHPLMRFAADSWIIEDPLPQSDAILVLSDDNFFADRVSRAVELFRQGKAPVIVASGRRLRPYAGIAELMEHDLTERGIPKDKIIRLPHDADSTKQEAEALAQLAAERKWRSVILVTSNYHTRRARYIFRRIFPQGMEVSVASARDGEFDPERWWEKRKSTKELIQEFAGMAWAIWELRGHRETGGNPQSLVVLPVSKPLLVV